jgi:hypothetical protein
MHKGMLSGLWSLKWVLLCLLLTACKPTPPPPTPPTPTPTPPAPTNPDITVTGKIMLGPVVRGHSLQLVIYDPDMKELYRPKIGLDGGYGFTLKDYEGAVIAQVTSINPQQDCSAGDYIDEATAKPKCLGKNSILSSTVLKLDNTSSDNQAKLHTTSVTTIAALNAGISINEDGTITVDEKLSPEIIDQSNKTIARALGLGDQSVAEYTPKSIITTDQKFQSGDAYSQALAEISGIEAEGKSLNSIVQMISASIGDNGQIAPAVQDMMVKGIQKVFNTAKELGADTSILDQINKRQDTYPDSIVNVDMVNAPEPPVFKHKTKTSNQQPTWEWISGGTGNNRYQYRFGAEVDLQGNRNWKEISSNSFTPSDNLKQGRYVLEIQEGHISDSTKWSIPIQSTIEIVANQKGSVAIQGEAIQGRKLSAVTTDNDGIQGDISYQWYRDDQSIMNATDSVYSLTEDDVNTAIMVKVSYIDSSNFNELDIQSALVKIDNVDDKPVLTKPKNVVLNEDADTQLITLKAKDIDNDDKAITYRVEAYDSSLADVVISANNNNQLQITPKQNQYGKAKITVTAMSNGKVDQQDFNLRITFENDAPVAVPKMDANAVNATEQTPVKIKLAGTDPDGAKPSVFKIITEPNNGTLKDNDVAITDSQLPYTVTGALTYTSTSDLASINSDSFTFKANDGELDSVHTATVDITIINKNDAPVAKSKTVKVVEQKEYSITLAGTDPDGEKPSVFVINGLPNYGTLKDNHVAITDSQLPYTVTGDLTYTSTSDLASIDSDSFTFKANDGDLDSSSAARVDITIANENDAPVAKSKTVKVVEQTEKPITLAGTDADGEKPTVFVINDLPIYGTLKDNDVAITDSQLPYTVTGDLTYTSTSDSASINRDSFTFKANDGELDSADTAKVDITIANENDAPVATTRTVEVEEQTPVTITLAGTDPDGAKLTFKISKLPADGTLKDNDVAITDSQLPYTVTGALTYTSTSDSASINRDSFTFKANDGELDSVQTATVDITITNENDTPEFEEKDETKVIKLYFGENANASDNPKSHLIKVKDPDENEDENLLVSLLDKQKFSWLEISEQGNNNWLLELKEDIDNKQLIAGYHNLTLTVTDKEGDSSSKNLTLNLINQIDSDMRFENITTTIPVCWDYTSTFDNYETFIKAQINSNIEQYQNDIKQVVVNETWEASAAIEFIGWSEDCTSDDQRLKLVIAGPQSTYNSKYIVEANTVVFVLNSNNTDQIDRRTIIHEFGHALGFPDEHKRFDVFRAGDQNIIGSNNEVVCKDIPNGMPILADEHNYHGDARKLHQLKVVTMKQWQEQPYDPFSIMNDCTTNQEYMENNGNKLSAADKKRAQQFYGAILKGTAKAHLMNNDEYFTGLYKNENYYHFYEYGVRNEDYEEVRVSDLEIKVSDKEESYFYILNKEGNNPILFKKVNQASDNIFIKPDNSNLISCRKPHGENTNTLMKSNCGKPEDYALIVNPNPTIYHFDDPYGPKNSFYLVYCGNDVSETITKDGLQYNVVDYSESNCLTKINKFKVNPLEHHYTERLFTANPKEKKNSVWFFRKGKALSGRIGPNANIRLKDGNNNPAPSLVIKNNQLVYTIDDSPFTGYIPNAILLWPEIIDMEEGYYLGGNLIPSDKINEKVESVSWKYLQTNSTYQIERNNVYVEYQGKLYKNGQLYTGIFEDLNYSKGVLDQ